MNDRNAFYNRNPGKHPSYLSMWERITNGSVDLVESERVAGLKVEEAEETVAALRVAIPQLEQSVDDATSFVEQRKVRVKLAEARDKLFFAENDLATLRIALVETQFANEQEKKRRIDQLFAENQEQLFPLMMEGQAISHAAERTTALQRHYGAERGRRVRERDELQATRRQELKRERMVA